MIGSASGREETSKTAGSTPGAPRYMHRAAHHPRLLVGLVAGGGGTESFEKPLLQCGEKMGADIAKCKTDAEIWMGVHDTGGSLEKVCLGKDLDQNRSAYRRRINHIQVAPIQADLGHASTYSRIGGRLAELSIGDEREPCGSAALYRSLRIVRG
jgi:hypothetical protein